MTQCSSRCWIDCEFQGQHLAASQSTAEQQGHHRVVAQSAQAWWALRAEQAPALFRRQPVAQPHARAAARPSRDECSPPVPD